MIGGFLKKEEVLDSAAIRILERYTGLQDIYMEQLHAYSDIDRDPVERTISVAYYALINIENHDAEMIENYHAQWFNVADAPKLIFDHDSMAETRHQAIALQNFHKAGWV